MSTPEHLAALLAIDDEIVDSDQENLEAIEKLQEKRNQLVESFVEPIFVPEEPPKDEDPDGEKPQSVDVSFTVDSVTVLSVIDRTVILGGDVRDGKLKLKAGQPASRKLSKEGNGYVSVDGIKFPRP